MSHLVSFHHGAPPLVITAETDDADDFDQDTIQAWQNEGFAVTYVPFGNGGKTYTQRLKQIEDGLSVGDKFAIVAFGDAAGVCLDAYCKPVTKCCALVAYYPSTIPETQTRYTSGMRVCVHLAGGSVDVFKRPEVLGIQGKRKTVRKKISPGIGPGGLLRLAYKSYAYEGVDVGFAEKDLEEYEGVADALAWSRSLDTVRKGFGAYLELERCWEESLHNMYTAGDAHKLMDTMTASPSVTFMPTLAGGQGKDELLDFFKEDFVRPASLITRIITRTIGADRIIDETYVSFVHDAELPWILPNIDPTGKKVEIVVVSIATMKAGKIYKERVYWDQASVLSQIGLLKTSKDSGVESRQGDDDGELPVVGAEATRVLLGMDIEHNGLLDG